MATAAPPNVGGGTISGVKEGSNETNQHSSTGQKDHQKKKRNRSKKKKGKGGVGGVGDGGGGGSAAHGSPTAEAGYAPQQKQKQRNQPPTQQKQQQQQQQAKQRDRGQRHRNKKEGPKTPPKRATQVLSTVPPQTNVPPSTTATVSKRAPAPVFELTEPQGAGGHSHYATTDVSNASGAGRHCQFLPSSGAATGANTPDFNERTETSDTADGSIRHDKDLVTRKGLTVANNVAPFECSWTTTLNGEDKALDGEGKADGRVRPKGEADGANNSEDIFQSFQEGELSGLQAQPDGSKSHFSSTVSPHLPTVAQHTAGGGRGQAGQTGDHVASTATKNESASKHVSDHFSVGAGAHSGGVEDHHDANTERKAGGSGEMEPMLEARPTLVRGAVADATSFGHSAVDEQSNPRDARKRTSEAKSQRTQVGSEQETGSLPTTKPQPQANDQGVVSTSGVGRESRLGSQSKQHAPSNPSQGMSTEQQRADNRGGRSCAADDGAGNLLLDDDEEDALLLPDAPTSRGSRIEQDDGGGVGHGGGLSLPKDLETAVLETATETAAEELLVDDIDDECTTLLERSPVETASRPKSTSRLALTSTTTGAAAASAEGPANDPPSLPSASSSAEGVTAQDAPSLPVQTPPPPPPPTAAPASTPSPSPTATAASTTFNYTELPAVPENAPEATGKLADRATRATDPSAGKLRHSSPSSVRPAEEHKDLSAIWAAVRRSDTAGVRAQLAAGATLDEADSEGRTPLMVACAAGDIEMVSLLVNDVSPPSSVAARTIEGWTPLMIAGGGGRLGVVKVLLEAGAAIHDKDDEFGSNSFMWACGGGHAEIVRLMLDHGAKELLHSVNADMWTPLMVACDAGSLATVQVLVEAGADLGTFNRDILTAMDIAADRKNLLVECYLRTEGAPSSGQFWSAADAGDANMISRLLRGNGHLVAALDADGRTALLRSCVGGHLEAARILVEAGADVDFQDSSGTSALSVSAVLGNVALTRYLVQTGGARLTVKNHAGWTPLMQAVAKGDLIMTRYLVDRGAAVNDGNPGGESVLDMAKRFSGAELQRYLAAKGGFSSHEVKRQIGEVNHGGRGLFRFW